MDIARTAGLPDRDLPWRALAIGALAVLVGGCEVDAVPAPGPVAEVGAGSPDVAPAAGRDLQTEAQLEAIEADHFDVAAIAEWSLRAYWADASDAQREECVELTIERRRRRWAAPIVVDGEWLVFDSYQRITGSLRSAYLRSFGAPGRYDGIEGVIEALRHFLVDRNWPAPDPRPTPLTG